MGFEIFDIFEENDFWLVLGGDFFYLKKECAARVGKAFLIAGDTKRLAGKAAA